MSTVTNHANAEIAAPPQPNMDTLVSVASVLPDDPQEAERFVHATLQVLAAHFNYHELLLIDNGSPLGVYFSVQNLQSVLPNVRLVRLSRRYSREVALAAALDHCIGDYVVIMDPAIHPPALIPRLVARGMEGCDSVAAIPTGEAEGMLDRIIGRRLYRLASKILGFELRSDESYYRIFSRRLVNSIVRIRSKNRYLSCLNASIGLHQDTISYQGTPTRRKQSPIRQVFRQLFAISDILVSNSAVPLRFASLLGVLASVGNLSYLVYILVVSLLKSHLAEGWLTTSLTNTTMFLAMFLILTIVSEYIARILDETKDQPLYFVESETNSVVSSTNEERLNVVQEPAQQRKSSTAAGS
jgi:polyisoprenyl-phosphate glycosyltransferase